MISGGPSWAPDACLLLPPGAAPRKGLLCATHISLNGIQGVMSINVNLSTLVESIFSVSRNYFHHIKRADSAGVSLFIP